MADERSVDVDEVRDQQADDGSRTPAVVAAGTLSPVQQAWGRYTRHTLHCPTCRDVDAGRCAESERLWKAFHAQAAAANDAVTAETGRRLNGEAV